MYLGQVIMSENFGGAYANLTTDIELMTHDIYAKLTVDIEFMI